MAVPVENLIPDKTRGRKNAMLPASKMSFSCPHFSPEEDRCLRLKTDCVPGRRGCVLEGKTVFAVPVEERLREKAEENRKKALRRSLGLPEVDE